MTTDAFSVRAERGARSSVDRSRSLTARQIEVLHWTQEGKTAWEIGQILNVTDRSVEGHLRRIYLRLNVHTRLQAVFRAQDLGLLARPGRRADEERYATSGSSSGSAGGPPRAGSVIHRST
jgi:DNA-binding CsgD family transcriptional regulator